MESAPGPDKVDEREQVFFQRAAWEGVDQTRIGIANMKEFLRNLLHEHIEREIPAIKEELLEKLCHAEKELQALGKPRKTAQDVRTFLIERCMAMHQLAQNALSGTYLYDADFFADNTRLRSMVHQANMSFAQEMRSTGEKRKLVAQAVAASNKTAKSSHAQISVTQQQMMDWVREASCGCVVSRDLFMN